MRTIRVQKGSGPDHPEIKTALKRPKAEPSLRKRPMHGPVPASAAGRSGNALRGTDYTSYAKSSPLLSITWR